MQIQLKFEGGTQKCVSSVFSQTVSSCLTKAGTAELQPGLQLSHPLSHAQKGQNVRGLRRRLLMGTAEYHFCNIRQFICKMSSIRKKKKVP